MMEILSRTVVRAPLVLLYLEVVLWRDTLTGRAATVARFM